MRRINVNRRLCVLAALAAVIGVPTLFGQKPPTRKPTRSPARQPVTIQPLRKASDLIRKQDPININKELYDTLAPDQSHVVISLSKQRAYLMTGNEVVIDSPISSGKRGHGTPSGNFNVMERDKNHRSNLYGDYRDKSGRVVRAGVSARIDSAPSGTHFSGAPMKWFMRLTGEGVGMHVGILPGYPASHGCIRMPEQAAELFYNKVRVGTRVDVGP